MRHLDFRSQRGLSPRWFHRRFPDYAATPLRELPTLAALAGVGRLFVKDESMRLGLPAFKMLGASWAIYRTLSERLGGEPSNWETLDDLRSAVAVLLPLTLAAATDGNHGRAVARMARILGLRSRIWVPANTVSTRIAAIQAEGATVHISSGGYDNAVAESAAAADARTLIISDTSWPGYDTVPAWVIEGYETILDEIDDQLRESSIKSPDVVFVPIGVGALAAAVANHYRVSDADTVLVGVEPIDAACMMESTRAGRPITLPGQQRSIMAGLNCGTPSLVSWPTVSASFDLFATVSDDEDIDAMRLFNRNGIFAGESGAASLAGLLSTARNHRGVRNKFKNANVVLLSTEGVTDPDFYRKEVEREPS